MRKYQLTIGLALFAFVLPLSGAEPAPELKAGDRIPGLFNPLVVTGSDAGQKRALVAKHGDSPAVLIFARQVSDPLTGLVRKLDESVVKNRDHRLGSFVVFLSNEEGLEGKLQELAKKEKVKSVVLAIDTPAGPAKYKISKDAEVVAILYNKYVIKSIFTLRKGELTTETADKIAAEIPRLLTDK